MHTVVFSDPSVTVAPDDSASVKVTLSVKASDVGSAFGFREVSGAIQLTPAAPGMDGGRSLRVPDFIVPRARTHAATQLSNSTAKNSSTWPTTITNANAARSSFADLY